MPNVTFVVIRAAVLGVSWATAAAAQGATRGLPKPEVEHREPFTAISGLRELSNGRVIVADGRDKTLQLIDLVRGTATPVGRAGAGPGEWGTPTTLYPLPGDSTLMPDWSNARLLLIGPDGKPAGTRPLAGEGMLFSADLIGVDGSGRMLLRQSRRPAKPTDPSVGMAELLVHDRRSARTDTIGTLAEPRGEMTAARLLPGGMVQWSTNLPRAARDLAASAPDGRVAIVRAAPYRVEWIAPNGTRITGPVAQGPTIRVTDDEKAAFARSQLRPGGIIVAGPSGAPPAAKGAASPRARTPKLSKAEIERMLTPDQTWPELKPPFLDKAAGVAPDGRLWVLRTRAHDDPVPTYDVFDGAGRVVERVALPPATRLIGFGKGTLYLARTDDDELVWLQRVRR